MKEFLIDSISLIAFLGVMVVSLPFILIGRVDDFENFLMGRKEG